METFLFFIAGIAITVSICLRIVFHPQQFWQFFRNISHHLYVRLHSLKKNPVWGKLYCYNLDRPSSQQFSNKATKPRVCLPLPFFALPLILIVLALLIIIRPLPSVQAIGPIVGLDWDVVDWPAPGNLTATFQGIGGPAGQADVTVTASPGACFEANSPDDITNLTGGLPITESLFIFIELGNVGCPGNFVEVNYSFSHPGGVSNVVVPIIDIDAVSNAYTDTVFISATDGTNTYLVNHPQTTFSISNTAQVAFDGTSTFFSIGPLVDPNTLPDGTVLLGFGQSGIQTITVRYSNPNPILAQQGIGVGTIQFQASQQADLELDKTVSNTVPNVGDTITFTLTILNRGPDPATGVTVADNLPDGFNFDSATPSQGTYNDGTGIWNIGGLAANGTATLDMQVTVNNSPPATDYTNRAEVASSNQLDPDSTPGNGTTNGEDDEASASIVPPGSPRADLAINKVSQPNPYVAGGPITYTIVVNNLGPDSVNAITVTDNLLAQIQGPTYTESSGTYNVGTGAWTGITLNANDSVTLTIVGTVQAGFNGVLQNTATVASPLPDPDPTNNMEPDTNQPTADLAINKVSQPNPYVAGGPITYTIVVNNLGPSTVNTITVTDNLPTQIQGPTYTESSGTYNPGTGAWAGITLNANSSVTLTIVGTLQAGFNSALQNIASVASPLPDPDPTNNTEGDTNGTNLGPGTGGGGDSSSSSSDDDDGGTLPPPPAAPAPTVAPPAPQPTSELPVLLLPETGLQESALDIGVIGIVIALTIVSAGSVVYIVRRSSRNRR